MNRPRKLARTPWSTRQSPAINAYLLPHLNRCTELGNRTAETNMAAHRQQDASTSTDPMEASRVHHGFVYRFAAGAYACRGGDELLDLGHGNGDQFVQCAEDVPEPVGEGHA